MLFITLPYAHVYNALCTSLRSFLPASVAVYSGEVYRALEADKTPQRPSVTVTITEASSEAVELGSSSWEFGVVCYLLALSAPQRIALKEYVASWMDTFHTTISVASGVERACSCVDIPHITDIDPSERTDSYWRGVVHGVFVVV